MRNCNIPINGSFFCIEEVQVTSLAVLAVSVKDMPGFMGMPEWEVKSLLASASGKICGFKSAQLAYCAQDHTFTRSGLFKGQPVFSRAQQQKLLTVAPWIHFEPTAPI